MGPTVSAVTDRIVAGLALNEPAVSVTRRGVRYPANPWRYQSSLEAGAAALGRALTVEAERSPSTRIVVIGLSQGAHVVRQTFAQEAKAKKALGQMAAVVLLGDPTRRPSESFQHGTRDPYPGVLAHRGLPLLPEVAARTWAWSLDGDRVAANRLGLIGVIFSGTHTAYGRNRDHVLDQASRFVLDRLSV